ncbi:hypothetical protein R1flu_015741 [Riccia fluitans]|uniref:PARP-type domain-containing protein n=1 Tax=Riccia fluitans TaxID=41844 RepID=A0ABD1YK37_9MARC
MGDYWTVSAGVANHTGHTCRECRGIIYANAPIYVRDGRKIRLFYHEACFSGDSDPRTQSRSSANERWDGISPQAPFGKGYGKWWTSSYGYSGSFPAKKATTSIGARNQIHALKEPTHDKIKQKSCQASTRITRD